MICTMTDRPEEGAELAERAGNLADRMSTKFGS